MNGLIMKAATPVTLAEQLAAQQAREAVIRNAVGAGFAGVGIGASARGLQGLFNLWNRTLNPPLPARKSPIVDIPVPGEEDEEKIAGFQDSPIANLGRDVGRDIGAGASHVWSRATDLGSGAKELLWGRNRSPAAASSTIDPWMNPVESLGQLVTGAKVDSPEQVPFGWLPAALLGGAGVAGGWKGLDVLLDRSRESELKQQEENAKEEYEQALMAQSKLGQALQGELDSLYDSLSESQRSEVEKAAFDERDAWGWGTNIYGLYALLTGLLGGHWAYTTTKARQRSALLDKARQKYTRSRESVRPTPVYTRATPMQQGTSMQSAPGEEELEGSPLDKAAGCGLVMAFAR